MSNKTKYWKGIEELQEAADFKKAKHKEFSEYLPVEDFLGDSNLLEDSKTSRRDFLKYLGFGVTAASLAACETPVNRVIPYVMKSDKVNPGVAAYYATVFSDGFDYCDILVKTREGRPIKIEGNKKSPFTEGGVNARVNSSVLSLYDNNRLKAPLIDGAPTNWQSFNAQVKDAIAAGGSVRILTNSISSPSTLRLINEFSSKRGGDVKHVYYDAVSFSGALEANEKNFGKRMLPSHDISKARSIVAVGVDFLSSYPDGIALMKQYGKGRNPEKDWMSKHYQFETVLSLSGSNADVRVPIKPSEQVAVLRSLLGHIQGGGNGNTPYEDKIKAAADHLKANRGKSVVFASPSNRQACMLANQINQALGNFGKTIKPDEPLMLKKAIDSEVAALVKEMANGSVDTLIVCGADPVYSMPAALNFSEAMGKVKNVVTFAQRPNATAANSKFVAAESHYLESWCDHNPKKDHYAIAQPAITPLFDTWQFQDCLLAWMGEEKSFYDYMKKNWEENSGEGTGAVYNEFWNSTLEKGFHTYKGGSIKQADSAAAITAASASGLAYTEAGSGDFDRTEETGEWELEFYQKVAMGDGRQAHNPWLQELPDPISKITWDNYITMNPTDARELGFATSYGEQKDANTVKITINGVTYEKVPVIAQPGQARKTLGVAVGYGQTIGKEHEIIGFNVFPAMALNNGNFSNYTAQIAFEENGDDYPVATTQTHQTIMGRDSVVRETTWPVYKEGDKDDYNPDHLLFTHDGIKSVNKVDLWADHPVATAGHHWGMSVDLNACIGCGSCVTSCNSENNVPVVGKDEVRRSREMHWIRIDRYFSSEEEYKDEDERSYTALEIAEENPKVVHQPMMCQHCNHAPCETVCPVAATTHSNEGINQMTYNRCIGTRYCANNCPYKVRRFNWFSYQNYDKFENINPAQDNLGRMVLNPDVTVRARGVMEKCSLCMQRIQ